MKYVIYARKSTESEDRQTLSIQSQIIEMQEIAKRENLDIVKLFQESKSAKAPGRPVFSEMIEFIKKGKADGILCWKIDRLARNPLDEGLIKWMLQKSEIKQIKTSERDYNPEDNVVIASIEFSMANQYIRDLSRNVKRGLAEKVRRGEYPSYPPLGYTGDPKTKRLIIVEKEAKHIRKAFALYVAKSHSIISIAEELQKEGLRTRRGKIIYKSTLHRLLKNPIYCGMFQWNGQTHAGTHEPIVSKKLFDEVQQILSPSKFVRRTKSWKYTYRGLMVCGECGLKITAEKQKGHVYYRCTKTFGTHRCSQPYLREEKLVELIGEELKRIQFDDEILDLVIDASKEKYASMGAETAEQENMLRVALKENQSRKDSLVEKFIDNALPKEIYDRKYSELSEEEAGIKERIQNLKATDTRVIENIETAVRFIKTAHDLFNRGDETIKREVAFLVSSNLGLKDRKIAYFNLNDPFSWLVEDASSLVPQNATLEPVFMRFPKGKAVSCETARSVMRGLRDDFRTMDWHSLSIHLQPIPTI